LKLSNDDFISDAWVYANLVVARLQNSTLNSTNTLVFYEKPLVANNL